MEKYGLWFFQGSFALLKSKLRKIIKVDMKMKNKFLNSLLDHFMLDYEIETFVNFR